MVEVYAAALEESSDLGEGGSLAVDTAKQSNQRGAWPREREEGISRVATRVVAVGGTSDDELGIGDDLKLITSSGLG